MVRKMQHLVLHLSELTKLSNDDTTNPEPPTVLHLSELTKLSNAPIYVFKCA